MRYLLFNYYETPNDIANDFTDITDEEFLQLALKYGQVYDSSEDFESAFNFEKFSTETHQLRIII